MTWFADLSSCTYFPGIDASVLRAIGWLEKEHPYKTGAVSPMVYQRLAQLVSQPFQPLTMRGLHECDLCLRNKEARGCRNLLVPGDGFLYVCPELITHYMSVHEYKPPEEFCEAILRCPDGTSMEYKRLFLANGGRKIMRPIDSHVEIQG